jgi:hypothetical protein
MRSKVFASSALACLIVACSKEEAPPPAPKAEEAPKEIELKITPSTTPSEPPPQPTKIDDKGIPDSSFIYVTTRRFLQEQKRPARDLDELITMGYMPPLPKLPPGKKYILNQRAASIQIVDVPK